MILPLEQQVCSLESAKRYLDKIEDLIDFIHREIPKLKSSTDRRNLAIEIQSKFGLPKQEPMELDLDILLYALKKSDLTYNCGCCASSPKLDDAKAIAQAYKEGKLTKDINPIYILAKNVEN